MSYDHVLLPSGVATTIPQVEAYLSVQQGLPETDIVARIAAELNRRNTELPEADAFLSSAPVGGAATGAALQVSCPYDAIGFVRRLLFDLATPSNYAVYDPQLAWLMDPAGAVPATVTHGGAGEFPYLTKALVDQWIGELHPPNPYLVVERGEQFYIQTYRDTSGAYLLEHRDGSAERHFGSTISDPAAVAALIWDWANDDHTRLRTLSWSRVEF